MFFVIVSAVILSGSGRLEDLLCERVLVGLRLGEGEWLVCEETGSCRFEEESRSCSEMTESSASEVRSLPEGDRPFCSSSSATDGSWRLRMFR